jgi:hypothetical protein
MPNDYSLVRAKRPAIHATSPDDVRRAEIINRGGAFHDRVKIEPKFGAEPRKDPLPSDVDIQKMIASRQTNI